MAVVAGQNILGLDLWEPFPFYARDDCVNPHALASMVAGLGPTVGLLAVHLGLLEPREVDLGDPQHRDWG